MADLWLSFWSASPAWVYDGCCLIWVHLLRLSLTHKFVTDSILFFNLKTVPWQHQNQMAIVVYSHCCNEGWWRGGGVNLSASESQPHKECLSLSTPAFWLQKIWLPPPPSLNYFLSPLHSIILPSLSFSTFSHKMINVML